MTSARDPLVGELGASLRGVLRDELGGVRRVALVDFPNHPNIGDSAIWLGELAVLRELGIEVVYHCDHRSYVPAHMRAALGDDGVILLHGGGNLGDIWPLFQRLRERVLADFSRTRTIQLPQTLAEMSTETRTRVARLVHEHADFRMLARDARTLAWFGEHFDAPARVCTDTALCLPARPAAGGNGVLWLAREDIESAGRAAEVPTGVRRTDWPRPSWLWHRRRMLSRRLSFAISAVPPAGAVMWQPASKLYPRLASERVRTGMELLGAADAVVTDRLHAHIFCLLLGVPHVLRDNRTGKLRGFYETWTSGSPLVRWADSAQEALSTARALCSS